jgi:hypothetical protein
VVAVPAWCLNGTAGVRKMNGITLHQTSTTNSNAIHSPSSPRFSSRSLTIDTILPRVKAISFDNTQYYPVLWRHGADQLPVRLPFG